MAAVAPVTEQIEAVLPSHDTKSALTPPTSEEWNNKAEGSASDILSDLEIDDDEVEEEIEPDHYYEGGKIPVFKPTMDQFRSFKSFVEKIDKYGMKSGIVKVIPPKEWRDSLPALDEAVKTIKVKNPITQEFSGTHGTYTQANIEKQRSYNLPQWKALTDEAQHQPPARRGEKRKNTEKVARPATRSRPTLAATAAATASSTSTPAPDEAGQTRRRPGRPRKNTLSVPPPLSIVKTEDPAGEETPQAPPTPTSPDATSTSIEKPKRKGQDSVSTQVKQEEEEPRKVQKTQKAQKAQKAQKEKSGGGRSSKTMSISERRKYNRQEKAEQVDEAAFENFDYRFNADEFTVERCNELETQYWKSLTFAPPMYGADMPGSLFDDSTTSWNVAKLENLLDVLGQKVPGVNTAYLYLGMWKATFAWHLEDVDLYSINYIHFGAPKQWYSISQEDARRFENAMKNVWPNDAKNCSQFLRHKTYLISPALLKSQYNIEVNKLVHYEGEFVITYPYGYHSGYNLGYNCAESVNFATEQWLDYGKIAKKCDCEADSVWINVEDIERRLRGEPTPEYDEVTDDEGDVEETITDLPSPPASVAGKPKPIRKRKRETNAVQLQEQPKVKKIKLRIRTTTVEPCALCPNNVPTEPLLPTDTGKHAHRACALYTPETYLSEENSVETVLGIANIDKARLDLKCSFCRSKKGACFQCSSRKCTRAYHATCAAPAGVQVDYGPTPVYGEDGTEYVSEGYDFRCRFHRPKRPKNITIEALETSSLIKRFARGLRTNDTVQIQYLQSEVFAGTVVENRPGERTVVVNILPDGDRVEIDWKWLTVLDPADSQLPKPTPDAKPLPAHLSSQMAGSRNLEFGPPLPGDRFLDPALEHKWAEFHTAPAPRNSLQVKIDFGKINQIWYYLGKTSTEARPQFTEDAANERFNPAGNFLDTLKPVSQPQPHVQRRALPASHPNAVNFHAQNAAMMNARQQSSNPPDVQPRPYNYKPKFEQISASAIPNQLQPIGSPFTIHPLGLPFTTQSSGVPYSSFSQGSSAQRKWTPPHLLQSPSDPSSNLGSLERRGNWLDASNLQRRQSIHDSAPQSQMAPPSLNSAQRAASFTSSYGMYGQKAVQYSSFNPSESAQAPTNTPKVWMSPAPQASMARTTPMANMSAPVANMASISSVPTPKEASGSVENSKEYEFLQHIQSYKYLLNSYCRRPKIYVSPYTNNGGFSDEYAKVIAKPEATTIPVASHYQECALPMPAFQPRPSTTKSYDTSTMPPRYTYPQLHHPRSQYGQYQTPQQFEQQVRQETNGNEMRHTSFERLFKQMAATANSVEGSANIAHQHEPGTVTPVPRV